MKQNSESATSARDDGPDDHHPPMQQERAHRRDGLRRAVAPLTLQQQADFMASVTGANWPIAPAIENILVQFDSDKKPLYRWLIGFLDTVDQPALYDVIYPVVFGVVQEIALDPIATTYLEQIIELLSLENEMLDVLRQRLPSTVLPTRVNAGTSEFERLLPGVAADIARLKDRKQPIRQFLQEFLQAYQRKFNDPFFNGYTVIHEPGEHVLPADANPFNLPLTSEVILTIAIPQGNPVELIAAAIEKHQEQMYLIETQLLNRMGYVLK